MSLTHPASDLVQKYSDTGLFGQSLTINGSEVIDSSGNISTSGTIGSTGAADLDTGANGSSFGGALTVGGTITSTSGDITANASVLTAAGGDVGNAPSPFRDLHLSRDAHIGASVEIAVQAGDPATVANKAHVYAKDVSTSAEIFVQDEAGNATQISPHDPETGEWVFYSENERTGRGLKIRVEAMLRYLEDRFGTDFIHEFAA